MNVAVYLCRGCGTEFATQDKYNAHDCGAHTPVGVRDPLLVEREKTHGSFQKNAETFRALCKAMGPQLPNAAQELAIEMIMVKLSRIAQQPNNKDSWADVAGYAKLGAEACDER